MMTYFEIIASHFSGSIFLPLETKIDLQWRIWPLNYIVLEIRENPTKKVNDGQTQGALHQKTMTGTFIQVQTVLRGLGT